MRSLSIGIPKLFNAISYPFNRSRPVVISGEPKIVPIRRCPNFNKYVTRSDEAEMLSSTTVSTSKSSTRRSTDTTGIPASTRR